LQFSPILGIILVLIFRTTKPIIVLSLKRRYTVTATTVPHAARAVIDLQQPTPRIPKKDLHRLNADPSLPHEQSLFRTTARRFLITAVAIAAFTIAIALV